MIARLPVNARSECVAPSTLPVGGVVEIMRMFQPACAASQRPALSPTRGSGDGVVAEMIGSTGFGMTAGGGGGGGGGVPRPPLAAGAAAGGVAAPAAAGAAAAGAGVDEAGGGVAARGGGDDGGGVDGAAAAGVAGADEGGFDAVFELAHAYTPTANAASRISFLMNNPPGYLPSMSCIFAISMP